MQIAGGGSGDNPLPSGWERVLNIYSNSYNSNAIPSYAGLLNSLKIKCYIHSYRVSYGWCLYGDSIAININSWHGGNNRVEIYNNGTIWVSIPLDYTPRDMIIEIEIVSGRIVYVRAEGQSVHSIEAESAITFGSNAIGMFGGYVQGIGNENQLMTYYGIEYETSGGRFKFIPCKRPYAPSFVGAGFDPLNNTQLLTESIRIGYTDL